jgi:hypothetical protein
MVKESINPHSDIGNPKGMKGPEMTIEGPLLVLQ